VYDPATNTWESRRPMAVARNHAFAGAVNGKIYVIGGRTGHAFILSATNTDVVEEYSPASDMWGAPKERMPTPRSGGAWGTDGRRIYVAGGEVTTTELVGAFRGIEAYEPATNSWTTLPSMPMPRHGVAGAVLGNRFHLVSGMIQSAGAMSFLDPHLEVHTGAHDVLELQFNPSPPTGTKSEGGVPSAGPKKPYTRYNVNSPEGQAMLAKYARAIEIMRELPAYDPHSWTWWWDTHWIKGFPAFLWDYSRKHKTEVIASLPPDSQAFAEAVWNGCQAHPTIPPTLSNINSGTSCPGIASCCISSRGSFAKCCTMRSFRFPTGTRSPATPTISPSPPCSETRAARCMTARAGPG
jgi:hypothetical protein